MYNSHILCPQIISSCPLRFNLLLISVMCVYEYSTQCMAPLYTCIYVGMSLLNAKWVIVKIPTMRILNPQCQFRIMVFSFILTNFQVPAIKYEDQHTFYFQQVPLDSWIYCHFLRLMCSTVCLFSEIFWVTEASFPEHA